MSTSYSNPAPTSSTYNHMASRLDRLSKYLTAVINGTKKVERGEDAKRLLEALCAQPDHLRCIERVLASSAGIHALQNSVRLDLALGFLNGSVAAFLCYLQDPSLEDFGNGQFVRKVVSYLVDPPIFWNAFVDAHTQRLLSEEAELGFAWLLLNLLGSPSYSSDVIRIAQEDRERRSFLDSPSLRIRTVGYRIDNFLQTIAVQVTPEESYRPGGRHDNDCEDFRQIAILPTPDEIVSTDLPYYRLAEEIYRVPFDQRPAVHHDNQFRLLREDLLAELRNDLLIARGEKKGRRSARPVDGLRFSKVDCGEPIRRRTARLLFCCTRGLPQLAALQQTDRQKLLDTDKNVLKHQSFGCLLYGAEIIAFASVDRGASSLVDNVPTLALDVSGHDGLSRVLLYAKINSLFTFLAVNTPVFAYEPILRRLQEKVEFPMSDILLAAEPRQQPLALGSKLTSIVTQIRTSHGKSLQGVLGAPREVSLDASQVKSLLDGLEQRISVIQGPPGTGKSFIGALIAKILHDYTSKTMMVICYTNHALDQFLEDLMDIGIPDTSMVRLGAKSTARTKALSLMDQPAGKSASISWPLVVKKRAELDDLANQLELVVCNFTSGRVSKGEMLEYLEFSDDSDFFDAFVVPDLDSGMQRVGKKNKRIDRFYLWDSWQGGRDAGVFRGAVSPQHAHIWMMPIARRRELISKWQKSILQESCAGVVELIGKYNAVDRELQEYFYDKKHSSVLKQKRIVACTTNAAARYDRALQMAKPDVILVEEAGEILESHVLTAMTANTEQVVLIGDHKQLRPKVNNYNLSVEKGDGFDLNRSLFERLILRQYPHTSLSKQHRMRPEVSQLIRHLTYPELEDAERTRQRPRLRGFQGEVIFMHHDHLESDLNVAEKRDPTIKSSKQNLFEVQMALMAVRYLGQQGYGTDNIVVLTPYLGQLSLLRTELSKTNDPILNDLDSNDLVRAGLLSPGMAKSARTAIRISTIDNYQGEESDIVVATLTRSNEAGDIGFMAAPERVNVLLSRARNALLMIGNANTFLKSRKGQATWQPLFDLLRENGHVYDGFPLRCERHPDRKVLVKEPQQFHKTCPDGGCMDPCPALLACNIHQCPRRCHRPEDHSQMKCTERIYTTCPNSHNSFRSCHQSASNLQCTKLIYTTCPKGHKYSWPCHRGDPKNCQVCLDEAIENERKKLEDAKLEARRQEIQREHARQLQAIDEKIKQQREILAGVQNDRARQDVLAQKQKELQNLTATANRSRQPQPQPPDTANKVSVNGESKARPEAIALQSDAKDEWERQKEAEGQSNDALDSLVSMIGLENVKNSFLSIKSKVEVIVRQGADLSDERFSAALLGNPGTGMSLRFSPPWEIILLILDSDVGKTTVARLYARFLSTVGVIPGSFFVETSGSKLATGGIPGCQKHLDEIRSNGGGAIFIDEAYQLTSGNTAGGSAVLDFLLAEVENLTGKIVFILAGYNKDMESFFAHNPGIPSRFPVELQFDDYTDVELQAILHRCIDRKYQGRMQVEGGAQGLYMRIVSRRIGQGRGRPGFGNARAVQNVFARITERQAKRLERQRRKKKSSDDMLLTKEDLLGPDPRTVLEGNAAWLKLQSLTGLESVKESVQALLDTVQTNYRRELEEQPLVQFSLNKVFVGNPGTGKTTVAKLYGQILADMGFLSKGEVVVKNPSDFVGNVLGASETATKGILAASLGKVLVIDEAYMLAGTSSASDGSAPADLYKTAVVDTLVAEVQSVPGDDRCVLLLGYKDAMERMFQNVNEGLSRRFPMSAAFHFGDYTDDDLETILDLKLKQVGFQVTSQARSVVRQCLSRERNKPNFGNAGEVDILLDKAKLQHQKRLSARQTRRIDLLEPVDFDPDFDRAERESVNLRNLFKGVVGCEDLIAQLEGYQNVVRNMKRRGLDPRQQIPFNFLFRGPPGTGKTSTARRMGQIFYDMGILATKEVVDTSATDLVGQYVGHTGPKTEKLLEKGLGKVLFIDEAYRLADGVFGKEAMDQLVDCLTKEKYYKRLIVILAGYDQDINRLMSSNPGLTSRFSETVSFTNLTPTQCWKLLQTSLGKIKELDLRVTKVPSEDFHSKCVGYLERLATLPGWGNARDVQTIADTIIRKAFAQPPGRDNEPIRVSEEAVTSVLHSTVGEREHRAAAIVTASEMMDSLNPPMAETPGPAQVPPSFMTQARTEVRAPSDSVCQDGYLSSASATVEDWTRDPGVSQEVWDQLQLDRQAMEAEQQRCEELAAEEKLVQRQIADSNDEPDNEELRKYEERLRRLARERIKAEEREKQEKAAQKKLRTMGVCPVGYQWIKQVTGYRCSAGGHFVSNEQLG
ncbi:AAA family ATPase [Aspergillus sclerotioniger CBS 115572]|uniref:AAA family ATPase n=1 Tax=Aspergillus sclerotioniger CBS 115572 TaxID=1450535 RepID=A0A317X7D3_9EURO|nr:AAA family ATPase [Aspergillus sclerotioniger CBS 115572]PWY93542.1 AAA family ATPase [Aspergillus sclerotioniger CBS 115572]